MPFLCFWAEEKCFVFVPPPEEFFAFFTLFVFDFTWMTFMGWTIGFVEITLIVVVTLSLIINPADLSRFRFLGFTNSNSDKFILGGTLGRSNFGLSLVLMSKRIFDFRLELHNLQVISCKVKQSKSYTHWSIISEFKFQLTATLYTNFWYFLAKYFLDIDKFLFDSR